MTIGKEGLDRWFVMVGKIFYDEGCSSELTEDQEVWFIEYLNSELDAGKRWWSEFRQHRDFLEHIHGSAGLHHLKTRIKKIIFMTMITRMIRIKTMIGTGMTQRSRLALLSLLIRFNHSICTTNPMRPHKIKRVAHYCKLHVVGGKSALSKCILAN
jgi:hypothetical protein